jgi:hypothetical protein
VQPAKRKEGKEKILPIRLMVGLWFLVPAIGVRVPDRQPISYTLLMIKWNEVTWYSRLCAIILFVVIVPAISFFIGMQFQRDISSTNEYVVVDEIVKKPIIKSDTKTTAPPEDIFPSPDGQFIAKEYSTEEISDTYIEDKEGKQIVGRHKGSFRSWFPDSKKILLYLSEVQRSDDTKRMYILTVDGEYYDTGLPADTYDAAYRHSDGAVVYTLASTPGTNAGDIFIRDANGVDRLLVKGDKNIFIRLKWSSDGKKVSFAKGNSTGTIFEAWEVNEDGTGLTLLDRN